MNYQEMLEECQRLNKLPRKSSNPKDDVFYVVAPTDHKNLNEYKKRLFDEKSSINPPDNIYKVKYQDANPLPPNPIVSNPPPSFVTRPPPLPVVEQSSLLPVQPLLHFIPRPPTLEPALQIQHFVHRPEQPVVHLA